MLWSLNEAKRQGYAVDEKALTEVTDWVNAADDRAKGVPVPPMPKAVAYEPLVVSVPFKFITR